MSKQGNERQLIEFGAILTAEGWKDTATLAELPGLARRLRGIKYRYSSVEQTEAQRARDERAEERIRARLAAILPAGFGAHITGDPRGAALIIKVPSGRYDDWGQIGICVPV